MCAREQNDEDDYIMLLRKFAIMNFQWGSSSDSLRLFAHAAKWMESRNVDKTVLIYQDLLGWIHMVDTAHHQDQILREAAAFFLRYER